MARAPGTRGRAAGQLTEPGADSAAAPLRPARPPRPCQRPPPAPLSAGRSGTERARVGGAEGSPTRGDAAQPGSGVSVQPD